jgi:hypothetical protein
VLGRTAPAFRLDPGFPQPAADRLPADPKPFALFQHLDEVGVIELSVDISMKDKDPLADLGTPSIGGPSSSTAMGQALSSSFQVSS